ncbi:MAG: hypothetical protein ACRDOK_02125, partial [Streptosporangiaceae bacterium]
MQAGIMSTMAGRRGFDEDEDFYEDDEPLEKIQAAFEHGQPVISAPRVTIDTHGLGVSPSTATQPATVRTEAAPV